MSNEVMTATLNFVFATLLPYVLPVLFLFMAALFSERLIDIFASAVSQRKYRRR